MSDNFVIYTDSEGKMPQLRRPGVPVGMKSHRYWVEYRGNRPVSARPYPGQEKVWDYDKQQYVPLSSVRILK